MTFTSHSVVFQRDPDTSIDRTHLQNICIDLHEFVDWVIRCVVALQPTVLPDQILSFLDRLRARVRRAAGVGSSINRRVNVRKGSIDLQIKRTRKQIEDIEGNSG